ncbi:hypothetical protein D3C87_1488430 [compost metagenome]
MADRVALIAQARIIGGPAGGQQVIADALAIDEGAVEPERADMKDFATANRLERKGLGDKARRRADTLIGQRAHHAGRPVEPDRLRILGMKCHCVVHADPPGNMSLPRSCRMFYVYRSTFFTIWQ